VDIVRYPEVGLGLLPMVIVVLTATAIAPAAADNIALVPLMTAGAVGIALVVADLYVERHLPRSQQL
jgi:hypothetical protein